jgi:hypothetical protein
MSGFGIVWKSYCFQVTDGSSYLSQFDKRIRIVEEELTVLDQSQVGFNQSFSFL